MNNIKRNDDLEIDIENKYVKNQKNTQFTIEEAIYILKRKDFIDEVEDIALENLIQENKELKEENNKLKTCDGIFDVFRAGKESSRQRIEFDYIPKTKVKELAKKYEFALNDYDSSTADYKHSQNLGRYMACVELLKEGE